MAKTKSLKFVQLKVRLTTPFGSEFFGTEDEDGNGDPIRQPLATPERKDVLIEVLKKLVAALTSKGQTSILVNTNEDGHRIVRDDTFPIGPCADPRDPAPAPAKQPAAADRTCTTPLIDLNKASKTKLCEVPGIGPARAAKIIERRPYKSVDELVDKVDNIDKATVNGIRSLTTVTSE